MTSNTQLRESRDRAGAAAGAGEPIRRDWVRPGAMDGALLRAADCCEWDMECRDSKTASRRYESARGNAARRLHTASSSAVAWE